MSDQQAALRCVGVYKSFREGGLGVDVLADMALTVRQGEQIAILGRSGSGKSTLLHVLGGLEDIDRGAVYINDELMSSLGAAARGRLRNRRLGFVYQFHHLLGEFTATENVAMPLLIRGIKPTEAETAALELLDQVGLRQEAPISLANSPVESVSVWPSPGHWSPGQRVCWPMSRLAIWISKPRNLF